MGIEHSTPIRGARFVLRLKAPGGGAPLAAQIDGEEWSSDPKEERVEIEVVPRALRLVVPA